MKRALIVAITVALVSWGGVAMAIDTTDVDVTANVVASCVFTSTPTLAFGVLDQTSALDAVISGDLVFWCSSGVGYTLGDETNPLVGDGTFAGTLVDGPNSMGYSITYTNFTGVAGGIGAPVTSVLTATIPNANYVGAPPGAYADQVTFTITP
jgi:hypothetical protein